MHMITTIRTYLGSSQAALAKAVGITQPDLSEIKTLEPYGRIDKYLRLSQYLGIPVDAIVKNDFTQIPLAFFDAHKAPEYTPAPKEPDLLLGRQGEEFILRRERDRLQDSFPALAKLVLPHYKMKGASPGYDILSFDDQGKPFFLEVKTSLGAHGNFRFTSHELDAARKLTEVGEKYILCHISNWGTADQFVQDIPFADIEQTHRIIPSYYFCKPHPKNKDKPISGLAYYRQLRGLRQADLAESVGIQACDLSLYETEQRRPSVQVYKKISECLDVSIDDLLCTFPCAPGQEGAHG